MKKLLAVCIIALLAALVPTRSVAATIVTVGNTGDWQLTATDGSPAAPPPSALFVVGPDVPPLGVGSLEFRTSPAGSDAAQARNTAFGGVLLSDFTALGYSSYVEQNNGGTSGTLGNGGQAPYIIMQVDYDGNSSVDDLLFFEPLYQGATFFPTNPQGPLAMQTWQTWDALAGGWYSVFGTAGSGPGANVKSFNTFFTPALGGDADARLVNSSSGLGGLRFVVGFGGPTDFGNFIGNIDNVTVDTATIAALTYDFEPDSAPVPEPATSLLIGAGLVGFLTRRRNSLGKQ